MRTESDPELKIDWTSFTDSEDQHKVEERFVKDKLNMNPQVRINRDVTTGSDLLGHF